MGSSFEKTGDGIRHYAGVDDEGVVCGEACDDPHGPNHESRCSREAWLARDERGRQCRSIIRATFGEAAVARIDAALARATRT